MERVWGQRPEKGDWLAELDNLGRVVRIVEVVEVLRGETDAFELFPEGGRPVRVRLGRCLEFAKPGAG